MATTFPFPFVSVASPLAVLCLLSFARSETPEWVVLPSQQVPSAADAQEPAPTDHSWPATFHSELWLKSPDGRVTGLRDDAERVWIVRHAGAVRVATSLSTRVEPAYRELVATLETGCRDADDPGEPDASSWTARRLPLTRPWSPVELPWLIEAGLERRMSAQQKWIDRETIRFKTPSPNPVIGVAVSHYLEFKRSKTHGFNCVFATEAQVMNGSGVVTNSRRVLASELSVAVRINSMGLVDGMAFYRTDGSVCLSMSRRGVGPFRTHVQDLLTLGRNGELLEVGYRSPGRANYESRLGLELQLKEAT